MNDDKRKEKRIPFRLFPENIGGVFIKTGLIKKSYAIILDVSKTGLGILAFDVEKSNLSQGKNVTLNILPYKNKLKTSVVHYNEVGVDTVRLGLEFSQISTENNDSYDFINELIKNNQDDNIGFQESYYNSNNVALN